MKKNKLFKKSILFITFFLLLCCLVGNLQASSPKTLKVGVVYFLGWSLGLDAVNSMKLIADITNEKGGIQIGEEKYNIELIVYDSKFSPEPSRSAVERLIHQDKVKFILADEMIDAFNTVTESNKVLTIAYAPNTALFNPKYKYTFQGSSLQTGLAPTWGWFVKNNPDVKTIVCAFPDNKIGRIRADIFKKLAQVFGLQMKDIILYPPDASDLTVVGTKVKTLNPDAFACTAGGIVGDSMGYKAVWEAGYKGKIWSPVGPSVGQMTKVVPSECLEGLVLQQYPTELPSPSGLAKEFKEYWIKKRGKWEHPQVGFTTNLHILLAALKKANSLNPEEVASVIANGLEFESVIGRGKMINRPDIGNMRTVDALYEVYMVRVEKGQPKVVANISLDEAHAYNKKFFGWK